MKILFILDNLSLEQEPLGVMHLSAALKAAGHETEALNGEAAGEALLEEVRRADPGILAFSSTTGIHKIHLEMIRRIRAEMDIQVIMGNSHATFFPEVLEEEGVDFICRGEGEEAFVELLEALEGKGGDPAAVRNIDAKIDGKITRNEMRPWNQNLDDLPLPDRELTNHLSSYFVEGVSHCITGRGCPYNCTYCFNHAMQTMAEGRYVRRRSAENVLRELKEVQKLNGPRMINFQDDTFILNRKWLGEFCGRYKSEIGLPYLCHVRADLVTEEIGGWLADSGCVLACLGLEAGNDYMRNQILNRNLSTEQIVNASRILRDHNIDLLTQNMMGIPYETTKTFWETLELNRTCKPTLMLIYTYNPYPRQELTELAVERGFFNGDFESLHPSYVDDLILDLDEGGDLESMARFGNLVLDSTLVRWAARSILALPACGLRSRALRWFADHQEGIRRRLGCGDSRWKPYQNYWK